ncbi:uncharacterized protein MONBRDRAFT_30877 [Monosiga brevicollis MX1]|uniref:PH domain-containing protein n=1 Tax=Monosiga brevicollis TaxID=81824 RepID=A9UPW1_MONBE|nr:uncharacterized protein MONBRDRAFT_30877 [Monosiga brevicollis MX1]EDQ92488.1 predicted protein [Monosiga brevicollis MX1]|eukprot:XP_001742250.1 hypothetical protein [Monosiga brevicollis MX1]
MAFGMMKDMRAMARDPMSVLTPTTREGYLVKLGFNSGKWQQRYFVLRGDQLVYYSKPQGTEKGRIVLNQSATVAPVQSGASLKSTAMAPGVALKQPIGEHGIEIVAPFRTGPRAYYMFTTTQADRDGWVNAIAPLCSGTAPAGGNPMGNLAGMMASLPSAGGAGAGAGAGAGGFGALGALAGMGGAAPAAAAPATAAASAPVAVTAGSSSGYQGGAPLKPPGSAIGKTLPAIPQGNNFTAGAGAPKASMGDMLGMAFKMQAAMKSHQNDPHLSKEDNAVGLATKIQGASGVTDYKNAMIAFLKELEANHLPPGAAGFVVTENPGPGSLAQAANLQPYDLIFEYEGQRITEATTPQEFGAARQQHFASTGKFTIGVYNFQAQPGMYTSTGQYARIDDPNPPAGTNYVVKAHFQVGIGMMSQNEYFPLYDYQGPALHNGRQVFVEAYTQPQPGMFVSSPEKYTPLPAR